MSPRLPKAEPSTPDAIATTPVSAASAEIAYDLLQRVSSIERSMVYLEARTESAGTKLQVVSEEIIAAKAIFRTLKIVVSCVGAVCVALWGLIATVTVMAAKHYLGW